MLFAFEFPRDNYYRLMNIINRSVDRFIVYRCVGKKYGVMGEKRSIRWSIERASKKRHEISMTDAFVHS